MLPKNNLQRKNWSRKEIEKAESIFLKTTEHEKHIFKITYWSALTIIVFANLIVSLALIPFLIVLTNWFIYLIVIVLAGIVGILYNFLITNIDYIEKKHHFWAGLIVPLISIFNIVTMVNVSNKFIVSLNINNPLHNPWIIGLLFGVTFLFPFVVDTIRINLKYQNRN